MIYDAVVECGGGCHLDARAVITGDAEPILELAGLDMADYVGRHPGVEMVQVTQAALACLVENIDEAAAVELEDLELGPDIVVGFLIVIRDAVLSHVNRGQPSTVTVSAIAAGGPT